MKKEYLEEIQRILMKDLMKDPFIQSLNPELHTGKETAGLEILVLDHDNIGPADDSALGQYCFLPVTDEDPDVHHFAISLTIDDDDEVTDERRLDMLQAITLVNYQLPYGAFSYDPSLSLLTYKRTLSLMTKSSAEEALAMIGYEIAASLGILNLYTAPLLAYKYEDLSWEEFVAVCKHIALGK